MASTTARGTVTVTGEPRPNATVVVEAVEGVVHWSREQSQAAWAPLMKIVANAARKAGQRPRPPVVER